MSVPCVEQSRTNLAIHREYEREGRNEKREEKGEEWEGMLAGFPFFLCSRPPLALLRFVPQVESFQRILCATGALIYKRERERERERERKGALYEMSLEWME